MAKYINIPKKYLNQFAKLNGISSRGRTTEELENDLINNGKENDLVYLDEQFKFPASYISICKPESDFPDQSNTPEKFINLLISAGYINASQLNTQWQPQYTSDIKICAIKHEGSSVYLKLVEEKVASRKSGYSTVQSSYAHLTSLVIHFGEEELIEFRCSARDVKKYAEYIMKIMGFATPYKWYLVPKLTREAAKRLCSILSAGIASKHIALPTTVGSLKFNGKKGVNLDVDNTFHSITTAIQSLGLPTNDTMDEQAFYSYTDPRTNIVIEVTFEVNIKSSYFKFTTAVPEVVIDHVLDILVMVNNESILTQK